MRINYTWQGSACPLDEESVDSQIRAAIARGELAGCACGILNVVVFGDRPNHVFSAFVNCDCGKVCNPRFRGTVI